MAAFAIMRCKKLASMGSVAAALKHCYRERETPNADPKLTPQNTHREATSTDEAMGRMRELLPEKRRKDAVLAVEYLMTASPEWWESASVKQRAAFFDQAHQWLADKYGADRIITATIHRDETSPHLSAFVVPLTQDGRLSAKEFVGNRAKMRDDQTTFAAAVADLGLHRGIEGSKARHTSIRAFYEALERSTVDQVTITPEALQPRRYRPQGVAERIGLVRREETPEAIARRLTEEVRRAYAPLVKAASGAREATQKARSAQEASMYLQERLKPVMDALRPLQRDMQAKAVLGIKAVGKRLLEDQQARQQQKAAQRRQERGQGRGGYSR